MTSSMSAARSTAWASPSVVSIESMDTDRSSHQPHSQQFRATICSSSSAESSASVTEAESGWSGPTSIVIGPPHAGHSMTAQSITIAFNILDHCGDITRSSRSPVRTFNVAALLQPVSHETFSSWFGQYRGRDLRGMYLRLGRVEGYTEVKQHDRRLG